MKLATIATICAITGAAIGIGGTLGFEKPWPDKNALDNVEAVAVQNRIEIQTVGAEFRQFAVEQRLYQLRRRLWQLMDRNLCDGPARDECRWLRVEIAKLEKKR